MGMRWLKKIFGVHKHNYKIPETIRGIMFLKCDYPGCNCYDISLEQEKKDNEYYERWMRDIQKLKESFDKLK